jgi:hypothetical protein
VEHQMTISDQRDFHLSIAICHHWLSYRVTVELGLEMRG